MKEERLLPSINLEKALEIVDGSEELLKEIFHDFIREYPKIIREIQKAVQTTDAENLDALAHSLKGMLINVAADFAAGIALELETMGKKQDLNRAAETLIRLKKESRAVEDFMNEYFTKSPLKKN